MRTCLPLLLVLAGCAAPRLPAPPSSADGSSRATIVAVRPIVPADIILATIGTAPAAAGDASGGKREFILRTEDGRIISIVADDDARWRTGRTVSVSGGDQAHLSDGS